MWIIIKSAGDEYSFTVTKIEGEIGHSYDYAQKLARKVTLCLKAMRKHLAPGVDAE